jgi:hypothetical protein
MADQPNDLKLFYLLISDVMYFNCEWIRNKKSASVYLVQRRALLMPSATVETADSYVDSESLDTKNCWA